MMAHLDAAERILDLDALQREGDWGVFHEFGHNMQVCQKCVLRCF